MRPTADDDGGRAALVRVVRDEWPRVLASLTRTTGSLQLAEDAVQDAVLRALDTWPHNGVPPEPRAWLIVTARRRAIDLLRREGRRAGKERAATGPPTDPQGWSTAPLPDEGAVRDDLLRLLFTCCHPALPVEAQTALALRTLCGLTTAEVAAALLVSEPTMAKRLVRAKHKIAVARIPFRAPPPDELPARLRGVVTTVYLLFNEGYHATSGDGPLRRRLVDEALRLAVLLRELVPDQISVVGLEALIRLQDARAPARLDAEGRPVRLADQDRDRWDRDQIRAGMVLVGTALRRPTDRPDPFVVQAAIAACHDLAPTWAATPWAAIVSWYDVLLTVADTPVVRVNRAVAVAELRGPAAGLAELEAVGEVAGSLPLAAARAELLARVGRTDQARAAFREALTLPGNDGARREVRRRLSELA